MKLRCAIGGHRAGAGAVYNSGYYFGACRRCRQPLVRTARSDWGTAPPGHRIVWRPGPRTHSIEADYAGVLPIAQVEPALPALRSPFVSWSRVLVRMKVPRAAAAPAAANEEEADYRCPRLLLVAVVAAAGLRMLLNLATGR